MQEMNYDELKRLLNAVVPTEGTKAEYLLLRESLLHEYKDTNNSLPISNVQSAVDFARSRIRQFFYEEIHLIAMNCKLKPVRDVLLNTGDTHRCIAYPQVILQTALRLKASQSIVWHTHPSGDCTPSGSDMELHRKLKTAFNAIEMSYNDFLIVSPVNAEYFSFATEGMM